MKKFDKILQDSLISNNLLSEIDLKKYIPEAIENSQSLKQYLLSKGILTERQILISLSQTLNTQTVDFRSLSINKEVLEKVPTKFAWYYKILPIKVNSNVLTVASSNPLDVKIQDEMRMHLGVDVDFVLAEENHLLEALKKYYGLASDTIDRIITKDPGRVSQIREQDNWIEDLELKSEDPTVSNLVNQIILEAYKKRATDIHIEPYRDKVRLRYRIDGVLVDANIQDEVKHFLPQILSRIKILANLIITEKRMPQDGSAVVKAKDQQLDLRVSTMPTPHGESIVLRILPTKVMLFSLEKLGFNAGSIDQFRNLLKKPYGIIFITGPTGSGKTTTLYACLNEINSSERKIITIEDPVEYEMQGITQVQVNPKVNFNFSTGLRSILRHDPDIIMVGEVRDPETAEIAIKTALTGHLVFSTLHTNDAASGVTRLIDMGIEPYLVASSVEAFVAQRLVRIICQKCKAEDKNPIPGVREEIAKSLKIQDPKMVKVYKGTGCDYCNQTGFYGRNAIYEILILNDLIRAAILEKPRSDYIKKIAMRDGLKTLRQNGWQAVIDGITTPDEVLNVTIKDEYIEEKATLTQEIPVSAHDTVSIINDYRFNKSQKINKSEYQERIYPRISDPVLLSYQFVKKDPNNPRGILRDNDSYEVKSENISAGGVRFLTASLIEIGSIIDLKITLDDSVNSIVECLARVCRVEEFEKDKNYRIATYFLDISSSHRSSINRFIEKKLKESQKIEVK